MNIKDVKFGMKVKFIYRDIPEQIAEFYPLYKETGIVKAIEQESNNLVIQTKNDKKYMVCSYMVEPINSDFDISDVTDEEILDMLKAKMYKNGLPLGSFYTMDGTEYMHFYKAKDMHKAIGIAYRCGYERAKKGRSFKYGDNK